MEWIGTALDVAGKVVPGIIRGFGSRQVVTRTMVIKTPRPAPVWPWYVAAGVGALVLLEK